QPPPTSPPPSTAGDARGSCLRCQSLAAARNLFCPANPRPGATRVRLPRAWRPSLASAALTHSTFFPHRRRPPPIHLLPSPVPPSHNPSSSPSQVSPNFPSPRSAATRTTGSRARRPPPIHQQSHPISISTGSRTPS
uniref:Uncharacterized protein n=1 Tax=Triticum urartu TaxID=4572 RepID=A0A8R7UQT2_TRIUA